MTSAPENLGSTEPESVATEVDRESCHLEFCSGGKTPRRSVDPFGHPATLDCLPNPRTFPNNFL